MSDKIYVTGVILPVEDYNSIAEITVNFLTKSLEDWQKNAPDNYKKILLAEEITKVDGGRVVKDS